MWQRYQSDNAKLSRILPLASSAVSLLLIELGLLTRFSVPAFQQDWLWPAASQQIDSFAAANLYAWHEAGAGYPAVYPAPWIPDMIAGIACHIFGVYFGLIVFIALGLAIGAFGMFRLTRHFTQSPILQSTSIILFLGSPVVLNEIQAGHLYYLISYAFLPFIADLAISIRCAREALVIGLFMGIGAVQQQFLVLDVFLLFSCWYFINRFSLRLMLLACFTFLLVSSPEWILTLDQGTKGLDAFIPLLHWERAQSISLGAAFRALDYTGGYDQQLLPPLVRLSFFALPAICVLAIVFGKRRHAVFFSCIIVGSVVLSSGLDGPLAAPLLFLFSNIRPFALFRELYDFLGLAAFGYAIMPSLLSAVVPSRQRAVSILGWILLTVASFAALVTAFQTSQRIARFPSALQESLKSARLSGYRYLPIPPSFPQATNIDQKGGLSPFLIGLPGHPSAASPYASFPEAYVASMLLAGVKPSSTLLARLGISTLVPTAGVSNNEKHVIEPDLRSLIPPPSRLPITQQTAVPGGGRLVILPFSAKPGTIESTYVGARDLQAFRTIASIDPNTLSVQPDPRVGWARTLFWGFLPRWVYAMQSGVFTLRPKLLVRAPRSLIIVGSESGTVSSARCRFVARLDYHWEVIRCLNNPILSAQPPIAISDIATKTAKVSERSQQGRAGSVKILGGDPSFIHASISAIKGSVIVLRESYNQDWRINIPHARHVIIDGYANGWVLSRSYTGPISIYFTPQTLYSISLIMSFVVFVITSLLAIGKRIEDFRRRRRQLLK